MTLLYRLLETIPLEWLQYDFMKNVLLATLVVTPLFALLGTMAVNNKMAFFSDALGHSAFTGIALGVLLGLREPVLSMLAFGIFLGLAISKVNSFHTASTDTVISVFSSASVALGIVILSKEGGFAQYSSYLIGDILVVSPSEILLLFFVLVAAYILWAFLYNRLLLVSLNPSLASTRNIHCQAMENIFVVMVAVAVMLSVKWIGILTINSLLILPAAAARNIAKNSRQYHFLTLLIGVCSGLIGLILSYYWDASAGASMVLTSACCFFITFLVGHRMRS